MTPFLIGRRGVNINEIEKRSHSRIKFQKFTKERLKLTEGMAGRRVRIIGTTEDNCFAYKMLLENIIKGEKMLSGKGINTKPQNSNKFF